MKHELFDASVVCCVCVVLCAVRCVLRRYFCESESDRADRVRLVLVIAGWHLVPLSLCIIRPISEAHLPVLSICSLAPSPPPPWSTVPALKTHESTQTNRKRNKDRNTRPRSRMASAPSLALSAYLLFPFLDHFTSDLFCQ